MDGSANGDAIEPSYPDNAAPLSQTLEQLSLSTTLPRSPARNPSNLSIASPKATAPNAFNSPNAVRRVSSSSAQNGALLSPKLQRKSSTSSVRNVSNPSSPRVATPRRASSTLQLQSPSTLGLQGQLRTQKEEPAPVTAASIALGTFTKELALHQDGSHTPETIVILHDACYGHRFSRPRTSKGSLSMIVERPERVRAAVLGVAGAYVRLGSRHSGGSNAPHPDRKPSNRFPFHIRKSSRSMSLVSPIVSAVHGKDWMSELQVMCDSAGAKLALDGKELVRPEQREWNGTIVDKPKFHVGDLYLCADSLNAFQGALGGVCDAVDAVFAAQNGPRRAFVAVRPPGHHCSADFPSGFCWLNNVHIGIEYAAQTYGLTHAAILDFDLHHGDGSQDITWTRNEQSTQMPKNMPFNKKISIGYYSMHDINSYPCELGDKEKVQNASLCIDNAHGQSIWNVHLQPWKTEAEFWDLYEHKYSVLLDKARSFLKQHAARIKSTPKAVPPKSAIFISAGFDASEWEGAGMQRHAVNVPTEFYARFTRDVVKLAHEDGLATDGRVISVLEGGYSDRALTSGVMSHVSGLCHPFAGPQPASIETGNEVSPLDSLSAQMATTSLEQQQDFPIYDADWWQANRLAALEAYVGPAAPAPARKVRTGMAPTYSTPTESFSKKVVDPDKFQRSMSGTWRAILEIPVVQDVPEVNWVVATHELSKLLIPSDRQTMSCKPEELAAPRVKKERQSMAAVIPIEQVNEGRQLRGRKAKISDVVPVSDDETISKTSTSSQATRRQTIGELPLSDPAIVEAAVLTKRPSRRSSIASSSDSVAPVSAFNPPVPAIPDQSKYSVPIIASAQLPQLPKMKKSRVPASKPPVTTKFPAEMSQPLGRPATVTSQAPPLPVYATPQEPQVDGTNSQSGSQDMDKLASAVKRITLKVGSREEHDRRQREREEAEKQVKAAAKKRLPKTAAPRARQSASATPIASPGPSIPAISQSDGSASTPVPIASLVQPAIAFETNNTSASNAQDADRGQDTVAQPTITQTMLQSAPTQVKQESTTNGNAQAKASSSVFNPFQATASTGPATSAVSSAAPEALVSDSAAGNLPHEHHAIQQDMSWQAGRFRSFGPETTASPPPQSSKLPVWSTTGTIPFGTTATTRQDNGTALPPPAGAHWNGNGVSRSMLDPVSVSGSEKPKPEKKQQQERDVYEVPETPQK